MSTTHSTVILPRYTQHPAPDSPARWVTQPTVRDMLLACIDALARGVPADATLSTGGYDVTAQWSTT